MSILRIGIIGMGSAGSTLLLAATSVDDVNVTAVADASAPKEKIAVAFHNDWRRLTADPDIDAVVIALPHHLHAEVAVAAFQAGKHVLLEKPIAVSGDEAQRIVAAARAARRVLMIEMTHHFYPPVRAARDMIRDGKLGRIYAVEDRIIQPVVARYFPPWLFDRLQAGGGVAMTNGIHMLDRVAWVCGQPLRFLDGVAGYSRRLGDVEDTASMLLALTDGTPVQLLVAWPDGEGPMDDELTIYGTLGILRVWAWRGWRIEFSAGGAAEQPGFPVALDRALRSRFGMAGALREFAAAVRERREPDPSPDDVLAAQVILDQFYARVKKAGA